MSAPLPNGTYDVFIVDAQTSSDTGDSDTDPTARRQLLSLTVTAGEHKGMVIDLACADLGRDDIELMGMPATLTISDGQPHVRIDD